MHLQHRGANRLREIHGLANRCAGHNQHGVHGAGSGGDHGPRRSDVQMARTSLGVNNANGIRPGPNGHGNIRRGFEPAYLDVHSPRLQPADYSSRMRRIMFTSI